LESDGFRALEESVRESWGQKVESGSAFPKIWLC
jgi:hypothetical protein